MPPASTRLVPAVLRRFDLHRDETGTWGIGAQLAVLLLGHVLLWTWVGAVSRSNFDAPGDMVEAYAWGQGWQWGYYKHPPLSAWIAGLWFRVWPETHWAYSLLAAANGAVGLAGLAVLAREFLPRRWVLLCVAAATLTPGITTLAMRFNANSILLSSWPWAMALFVRLMHRNRASDAVLCGLACALAVLGKYYSGVLLLTLLACSLLVPDWRRRWATAGPWLTCLTFVACVAPHVSWLLAQTQGPLQYAAQATVHESRSASVLRALNFALAQWVFPALAFGLVWASLRGRGRHRATWQAVTAVLRPRWEAPWLLAMAPIIATMVATVLTGARTASVWGLPISAGVLLLAVHRARETPIEVDAQRLWRVMAGLWLAIALLAPLWWQTRAQLQSPGVTEPRLELAEALDELWQQEEAGPLPWVTGTRALAASTSFYLRGEARYWSLWQPAVETPWVDLDEMRHGGGLIVCGPDDEACDRAAQDWSAESRSVTVAKHERGHRFAPVSYRVYLMRPAAGFLPGIEP